MKTLADLERDVLASHDADDSWPDLWGRIGGDVGALEPYSRKRFRRLYSRLHRLHLHGDESDQQQANVPPWETDAAVTRETTLL